MSDRLDEQVAETIMGWTRPLNRLPDGEWKRIRYVGGKVSERMQHIRGMSVPVAEWTADKFWCAPDGSYHSHPPDYSGDWGLAGEVLILLRKTKAVSVNVHDGPGDLWQVEIDGHGSFALFPEAVCRAALKAKEARDET